MVLAVELDGKPQDEPILVHRHGRSLTVAVVDLRTLGIHLPAGATGRIDLATVKGLVATIDQQRQLLILDSPREKITRLRLEGAPTASSLAEKSVRTHDWGGFINYQGTAYRDPTGSSVGGTLDGVVFTPRGFGYAGLIARTVPTGSAVLTRTDIGYTLDQEDRLLSATVGDFINAASSVSRPVRMAGIRVGTDFSLRPDLVTFPLPSVNGTAAAPTAVDLLVNGDRQSAGDVRAGQFAVADIPVQTGINTISVATRDALGRPQLQTVTTYASREQLRRGLVAYSVEAGWVRTGYLTASDRYRAFAGTGTVRAGLSDRLTVEAHLEAVKRAQNVGAGLSLNLGRIGLLGATAAVSRDETLARSGGQFSASLERVARPVSFSARYVRQSPAWSDIARRYGSVSRDHTAILSIGFDLGRAGTLGTSLIGLGRGFTGFDARGRYLGGGGQSLRASTLVNATYNVRLAGKVGLLANLGTDTRQPRSLFVSVGVLMLFGSRTSAYAGSLHQTGETGLNASVTRNAVEQEQWGFRAAASTGRIDQVGAGAEYLGRGGDAQVTVQSIAGRLAAQASARGSIGFANGHAFASDTMTGSFAVIETKGQAGIPVYQDNRRIGVTNARGVLVAPNLPSFQKVKFSIDPTEIPNSAAIDRTDALLSIPRRSGALLRFDLTESHARLVRVVDTEGLPLPAGARARIGMRDYPVGIGGALYADLPPSGTEFHVVYGNDLSCSVTMPAILQENWAIKILRCVHPVIDQVMAAR